MDTIQKIGIILMLLSLWATLTFDLWFPVTFLLGLGFLILGEKNANNN
jgi:hypothetical protein